MPTKTSPLLDILLFLLFVIAGLFLSQFLAIAALLPFHQYDATRLMNDLNQPLQHPEMKMQLLFVQGISAFCAFVLAPWTFIKWKEKQVVNFLYGIRPNGQFILLTAFLIIAATPFISLLVEWNESIQLPKAFSFYEKWAREKEDHLKEITDLLTDLNNPAELFWGLIVIAFFPALGEELVFRGYLQNKLCRSGTNPHFAIWFSAILFSAIHLQFFGFFPRMVLGALFGYLYHFSGQFHLPVVAHFTNNGLMLTLIYLKNKGHIAFDIEKEEQVSIGMSLGSLLATLLILFLFYKQSKNVATSSSL